MSLLAAAAGRSPVTNEQPQRLLSCHCVFGDQQVQLSLLQHACAASCGRPPHCDSPQSFKIWHCVARRSDLLTGAAATPVVRCPICRNVLLWRTSLGRPAHPLLPKQHACTAVHQRPQQHNITDTKHYAPAPTCAGKATRLARFVVSFERVSALVSTAGPLT